MQKFNGKMILIENIDEAFEALDAGKKVVVLKPFCEGMPIERLKNMVCLATLEKDEPEEKKPEPPAPVANLIEKLDKAVEPKNEEPAPKKKGGRPKKSLIPDGINVDRIIELHKQGWSRERIANNCDCSANDVITVLREKGVIDVVPAA